MGTRPRPLVWALLMSALVIATLDVGQRFLAAVLLRENVDGGIPLWRPLTPMLIIACCLALSVAAQLTAQKRLRWIMRVVLGLLISLISLSLLDITTQNSWLTTSTVLVAVVTLLVFPARGEVESQRTSC